MNAYKKINIPLEVVLGTANVTLEKIAGFKSGTVIELNSFAGEPAILKAAGSVIAKGEVVVIDENFGLRITELIDENTK